ncbi:MAG TPA: 3-hydroxyacyl-CoA dehydrogenase NAD-binding domain-containing protein [Woeseiaceae bacterium]|nr:3-hydroxyacyl-CoA dehydrogenase NAD-binding domain-containing protein [Woeseiaceae bacterium]
MPHVKLERRGTTAVISVDNPPVNALSHAVREGLMRAADEAEEDRSVQALVLICSGRTFIAGADIREFDQPPKKPYLPDVVARLEACSKPILAAIHGTALGGGLEVAMGCHYRLALESAKLGLPEVKLGLLPGATGTQRLPRLVGAERALEMMLSGEAIDAQAALDAGLVDRVTGSADLLAAALGYAQELSEIRRVRDLPVPPAEPEIFERARRKIAASARGLLSPEKIVQAVELAAEVGFDEGVAAEREFFAECKDSPQSSGLRHAFFAEREAAKVPGVGKETPVREIQRVAVLGAGTMGSGIAYACLGTGCRVHLLDSDADGLARGEATIRKLFEGGVARGKLTEHEAADGIQRLRTTRDYADLADADLVVEAVFENMAVKKEVFGKLDTVCKSGAILATNTSTLDVDAIAEATGRPQDVVGLHFFSPAHVMRLLEIVRGRQTADDVIATALSLAKRLRKVGVVVGNCFGFVGNRMLYSYGRENQLLLLEGAAPECIDRVLTNWGMAMGPNAVGDLAGLDVGYKIRQERADRPDDPRFYRVADRLAELGRFGQKTGAGMYRYEPGSRTPVPDPEVRQLIRDEAEHLGVEQRDIGETEIIERCIYALVTEGARILEDGIAARSSDIDVIWINGYGFPRYRGGPMHFADTVGADTVYNKVCEFRARFGDRYWRPPALLERLARTGGRFGDL